MIIYYFNKNIIREGSNFGNFKKEFFQSKEELIDSVERVLRGCVCNYYERMLTDDELESIIEQTMPDFDFYSVQTIREYGKKITLKCFKTFKEAEEYCGEISSRKIIGQYYGKFYRNISMEEFLK